MDSTHKLNDLFDQTEKLLDKLADERGPEIQELREKTASFDGTDARGLKERSATRTRQGARRGRLLQ